MPRHLHSLAEIERIAKTAHQACKALREAFGDHSQYDWEKQSESFRIGAIAIVRALIANPNLPSSAEETQLARAQDNVFRAIVAALA